MKTFKIFLAVLLVSGLGLLVASHGLAAKDLVEGEQYNAFRLSGEKRGASTNSEAKQGAMEIRDKMPVYKPPLRGAPGGRLGGGTRGGGDQSLLVSAFAPDHLGLTSHEQPSLYWFLSAPTKYPIKFTLIEAKAQKPLVEIPISHAIQPGVQAVRLADYNVRLKTGVQYQWYVAVVTDPEQRSKDIISGGEIERVDLDPGVRTKLEQAGKSNAAFVYAEEGFWYDALSALADLIATTPGDSIYHKQRAALLSQVGLKEMPASGEKR
jgi:Domain of Unknown Function (DUF928)